MRPARAGEVLFSPADDAYDLLVVLDGEVEVTEEVRRGQVRFAPHGRGQFVGELNLLTGQRPFRTARVTTDGQILGVAAAIGEGSSAIRSVHQYLAQFPDHAASSVARLNAPAPGGG